MKSRAVTTAETGQRLIRAAMDLFGERLYDQVSLQEVAQRAGVTFQTVMRRFESKEKLFAAAADVGRAQVLSQRNEAPVGDARRAVKSLVEEYERLGDMMIRFVAQEERVPAIRDVTIAGRALHREWVERTFAPTLERSRGNARRLRVALLITATDLAVWKLLRRDLGLSKPETERAMSKLLAAAIEGA
jgi:AcrR family transcriptional regulator